MSNDLPKHDHRRVGRDLNLFHIQEEAAGSIFWHKNGWTLYRFIENYIRDKLESSGYDEVRTPQLYDRSLWEKSGHWDNYGHAMFSAGGANDDADEQFRILKPMNCPAHVQIFNSNVVSYKELPMRLAEFGCCHRNEPSGSLHGIMRVRQFTQDDAHIFCEEHQVESETKAFCELLKSVYSDFGFKNVKVGFSTRPDKRAGSDDVWDKAEAALEQAVKSAGIEYVIQPGDGAFYGPKLEFALTDSKGREWQCGTIQLDFVLPERLGAKYMSKDGVEKVPVMIHRAILGSLERFIGIVLEDVEGRLPFWMAPVQVSVITVNPDNKDYADSVVAELRDNGIRVVLDDGPDDFRKKIKHHSRMLVPYMFIIGDKERETGTVNARVRGSEKHANIPLDNILDSFRCMIRNK